MVGGGTGGQRGDRTGCLTGALVGGLTDGFTCMLVGGFSDDLVAGGFTGEFVGGFTGDYVGGFTGAPVVGRRLHRTLRGGFTVAEVGAVFALYLNCVFFLAVKTQIGPQCAFLFTVRAKLPSTFLEFFSTSMIEFHGRNFTYFNERNSCVKSNPSSTGVFVL
jgi:hypothetical protein